MATSAGFNVQVVVNGLVLPEQADGVIAVPFGAEYALRFSSTIGRRATVKVKIDGVEVTDGGLFVVPSYSWSDLKRPTSDGNTKTFKFASTASEAAGAAGKAGPDVTGEKGLIECEFLGEKYIAPASYVPRGVLHSKGLTRGGGGTLGFSDDVTLESFSGGSPRGMTPVASAMPRRITINDGPSNVDLQSGVTVEGRESGQAFSTVHFDTVGPAVQIRIKLKGYVPEMSLGQSMLSPMPATASVPAGNFCGNCGSRVSPLNNNCTACGQRVR